VSENGDQPAVRIAPPQGLGDAAADDADEAKAVGVPRKKTRRGSRGGRNRRKRPAEPAGEGSSAADSSSIS